MGQFLDHDMMFDRTSQLGQPTNPITVPNARTPAFDLDTVYGEGPLDSPQLYDPNDPIKLRVEAGGLFEDLPRDPATNAAILGDPRNDENLMLAGLHAAFLLFHNHAVDLVREQNSDISDVEAFVEARRLTTYHYQWLILNEFLPLFVGQAMVDDILANGRRFYTPRYGQAFIPVEFQIVYRFGHSMVRPSYRANLAGDNDSAILRNGFRSGRRGQYRSDRFARRRSSTSTVHRLADLLRLRRRPANPRERGETEQANRHEALFTAVQHTSGYHPRRDSADVARAA